MLKYLRIILLCAVCFIFSKNIYAQTFEAGLIAGMNLSQLHGDGLAGFNQIGLNFGGRVAVTPVEKWKWSLDFLYSQKGSNKGSDDPASIPFDSFRLNYTEVNFMVHFLDWREEDTEDEFYKLHFDFGVAWGRLLDFKVKDIFGTDISESQDFNKNMLDIILGATFYINNNIGVNGQYSYTVNNVRKDKEEQSLAGRTLTFRILYMF